MPREHRLEHFKTISMGIIIPLLGLCYYLFTRLKASDFSSPDFKDWIQINFFICLFFTVLTVVILLSISIYFQVKKAVFLTQNRGKKEIDKNDDYSTKAFIAAFAFVNFMIVISVIFMLFLILLFLICPLVYSFLWLDKLTYWKISLLLSIFLTLLTVKQILKTKIGIFFKSIYYDVVILNKKFKAYFFAYLAICSFCVPFLFNTFQLSINQNYFNEGSDEHLIVNINLGGMTSSTYNIYTKAYDRLRTYIIGQELRKEVTALMKRNSRLQYQIVVDISDLPVGEYGVISFYKKHFLGFLWDINRKMAFQIIQGNA